VSIINQLLLSINIILDFKQKTYQILIYFVVPMAKACFRHFVIYPTSPQTDQWKEPEWNVYLEQNAPSLPSEFLAFFHPEGSNCAEVGISPTSI